MTNPYFISHRKFLTGLLAGCFMTAMAPLSSADVHNYTGLVEGATGAFSALTPVGSGLSGTLTITATPGGTSSNPADLTASLLKMTRASDGGTLFCFNLNSSCEPGETEVPIVEVTALDLTFSADGCPTTGTIDILAFSPTFMVNIPISLDVGARTFFSDAGALGTVSGSGGLDCPDSDNDGVADAVDNCTLVANANQRDTNGDGFGNACDPDLDNNGIVNFTDVSMWAPFFNTMTTGDADFNGDGLANFGDYAIYPNYFLQPPGPSGVAP